MQPVELAGDGVDGDFDGVVDEMTVGDMTALAVYLAAQPRPDEARARRARAARSAARRRSGARRSAPARRSSRACAARLPSADASASTIPCSASRAGTRRTAMPASRPARARSRRASIPRTRSRSTSPRISPTTASWSNGREVRLGALERDAGGGAIVRLLRRPEAPRMGARLAERIDEVGSGAVDVADGGALGRRLRRRPTCTTGARRR